MDMVRGEIAQLLMLANVGVSLVSPPDILHGDEVVQLTDALAAEVEAHPKLAAYLAIAGTVGVHAQLLAACVNIALPRLVRHGVLPAALLGGEPAPETVNPMPMWSHEAPSPFPVGAVSG